MAKKTDRDPSGTSFHGTTITASVSEITSILGAPSYEDNSGTDKVTHEWICETDEGDIFTIYDWKEYRSIRKDEDIEFHIGGNNRLITSTAYSELVEIFANK